MCGFEERLCERPHRYIHPHILQPFSLMKNKRKTQSLKLFEFFLYQMSMVLTAAEGRRLETAPLAPCPFLEHLPPSRTSVSHSQVTISCLETQHISVTLDCFVVSFCTCLLSHSGALRIIIISPCLSSCLWGMWADNWRFWVYSHCFLARDSVVNWSDVTEDQFLNYVLASCLIFKRKKKKKGKKMPECVMPNDSNMKS